jgi:hypothetical protein
MASSAESECRVSLQFLIRRFERGFLQSRTTFREIKHLACVEQVRPFVASLLQYNAIQVAVQLRRN